MTESLWEPGTVQEPQPNQEQNPEPPQAPITESETMALSVDEFSALEERVLLTVNLVKRERLAHAEAEERAAQIGTQLQEKTLQVDGLQTELKTLRMERDQVRQRVERLLSQLDALEL